MELRRREHVLIREANEKDAAAICNISSNDLGYVCEEQFVLQRLAALDFNREVVFVAEIDGAVAGYVHAEIYSLLYWNPMVNILGLAVALDYRRKGVGKALMTRVEEWAMEKEIKEIRLNSGGTRKEAHEFYRAMGFDNEKMQIRFIKELNEP